MNTDNHKVANIIDISILLPNIGGFSVINNFLVSTANFIQHDENSFVTFFNLLHEYKLIRNKNISASLSQIKVPISLVGKKALELIDELFNLFSNP